jgi:hypothetical protein
MCGIIQFIRIQFSDDFFDYTLKKRIGDTIQLMVFVVPEIAYFLVLSIKIHLGILYEQGTFVLTFNQVTKSDIHTPGNNTYKYDSLLAPIILLIIKGSNIRQYHHVY